METTEHDTWCSQTWLQVHPWLQAGKSTATVLHEDQLLQGCLRILAVCEVGQVLQTQGQTFIFNSLDVIATAVANVELNLCGRRIFRTHRLLSERSIGDWFLTWSSYTLSVQRRWPPYLACSPLTTPIRVKSPQYPPIGAPAENAVSLRWQRRCQAGRLAHQRTWPTSALRWFDLFIVLGLCHIRKMFYIHRRQWAPSFGGNFTCCHLMENLIPLCYWDCW